jgi:hypothetical protein
VNTGRRVQFLEVEHRVQEVRKVGFVLSAEDTRAPPAHTLTHPHLRTHSEKLSTAMIL